MYRQRWSEAGRYRRLAVYLLFAQAGLIVAGVVVLTIELSNDADANVAVAARLTVIASLVPIVLHGLTAWAVLSGSLRGRVFATLLSAASYLIWFPQYVLWFPPTGWLSLAISVLATTTCALVWLRDPTEGATGIGHPRPLE